MYLRIIFTVLCLMYSGNAFAELSFTNRWRIEQASQRCSESGFTVKYTEYWKGAVKIEDKETLCIAEQYADGIILEGADTWLTEKASVLIEQCEKNSYGKQKDNVKCLQQNLEYMIKRLSASCAELGKEKLWDADMCRSLIGYIFVKRFEVILDANLPPMKKFLSKIEKLNNNIFATVLFNPIMLTMLLFLYVLDIVLFIDPGNWMRTSKMCFIIGIGILGVCFLKGGMQHFISGLIMLLLLLVIIWNHININRALANRNIIDK